MLLRSRHGRKRQLARLVSALQLGSEGNVDPRGLEAAGPEELACGDGFYAAPNRQWHINPSREASGGVVPLGLSVPNQN